MQPNPYEAEKASNSYLVSLVAMVAGMPLPIINLLATVGFYLGNRKSTYFVRWHCTQALLSQVSLLLINSYAFWWTMAVIFSPTVSINNQYIAYMMVVFACNLAEIIATIYTAIQTRKGKHVSWWFYGSLTDLICKQ